MLLSLQEFMADNFYTPAFENYGVPWIPWKCAEHAVWHAFCHGKAVPPRLSPSSSASLAWIDLASTSTIQELQRMLFTAGIRHLQAAIGRLSCMALLAL